MDSDVDERRRERGENRGAVWRPTAPIENLRRRGELLTQVRRFFAERGVLEVETPLLGAATATYLHLASLSTTLAGPPPRTLWLQTSPELHMKRLLAAGSGPIWQLGKAFRDGESGRRHNPEFTMLEWYRPGWDHHRLMDEVEELLRATLPRLVGEAAAETLTYREAFQRHAGVDPFADEAATLQRRARELGVGADAGADWPREEWLHLLFSAVVEPRCGWGRPLPLEGQGEGGIGVGQNTGEGVGREGAAGSARGGGVTFVHDFPAAEAALARVRPGDPPLAERFEAFVAGVELANGYHELADPTEQRRRFDADRAARRARGLPDVPHDERLLAALAHGFPDCAGVALGFDRLVMLALGASSIEEVIAFPVDRA
ncbi:MAG TPA: EF-P lysine aminoacylase GenX [Thermoanaerobaculia bacterium]|nr:EF-P lysine aminoacylase GenX [Thermoanaerobaculia bacterium]